MRRLLFFIVITAMGMGQGLSQSLIQTYTDRCTGQTQVFSVPFNGTTVVTFYNRSKTFTYQDFQDGTLRAWLEETYLWWTNLSPCSSTTTGATATQQTTQQTASTAASAASNATANTTSNVPATGTTQNTSTSNTSTGGTNSSNTTEGSTNTNSSSSSEGGSSSSEGTEGGSSTEETKTEETKTEESKSEEKEVENEESNESKEEDSKEEESKEKSDDEESEDSEEENSDEEKDDKDKEEEDKKKKKERTLAPPIINANMLTQQSPLGGYDVAASFGVSQSSLLGDTTYGANLMAFSNGQQFMLTLNYSKVHITNLNVSELTHGKHKHYSTTKKVSIDAPTVKPQPRANRVYSASIGAMKVFTTYLVMMNHSMVWLGKDGSASGVALGTTLTSVDITDDILLGISATGFYTKPFQVNPKLIVTPMLAISAPFAALSLTGNDGVIWNKDLMIIGGPSFTYRLTQRFGLNLGVTFIESTIEGFPTMKSFTIGGRLSF